MEFMDHIHYPTFTHAPAYFIGLLVGYKVVTRTRIEITEVSALEVLLYN